MKVKNEIKVVERNGREVSVKDSDSEKYIGVHSHWNRDSLVVILIGEESVTVSAKKLKAAIRNATNTGGI